MLRATCECLERGNEGIQFLHEENPNKPTCYAWVAAVEEMLRELRNTKRLDYYIHRDRPQAIMKNHGVDKIPGMSCDSVRKLLSSVWIACQEQSAARGRTNFRPGPVPYKQRTLERAVNRVACTMLNIKPLHRVGDKVSQDALQNDLAPVHTAYAPVFAVELNYASSTAYSRIPGVNADVPVDFVLRTTSQTINTVAVRQRDKWFVDRDNCKKLAKEVHGLGVWATFAIGDKAITRETCVFCNDSFARMSKHLSGAKHIDRFVEVVNMVCRASSTTGLRMLNNPKHRGTFLRRS
ncbi:hypothetical protein HC928_02230 [bacterium]|nr:hypothetical protein [bacterium]